MLFVDNIRIFDTQINIFQYNKRKRIPKGQ